MCGIFFIKNNGQDNKLVTKEFNKSKLRGPDDSKLMLIQDYYIGFHRLSINGLDEISNQPFEKKGVYLICNGEIYNYKKLYELIKLEPKTNSDCEIILDLYFLYSPEYFVSLLDGVFSFVIYDTNKKSILIARDPLGVRPLFYSKNLEYFSSELKQITNLTNENIIQFTPGTILKINLYNDYNNNNDNNNEYFKYFSLSNNFLPNNLSYYFYTRLIHDTLLNSVEKRLLSDRPIACLLSGGLDSSLITSIVCKLLKNNLNITKKLETFSIGLPGSTDLVYAKKVAEYLDTNHTEIIFSEDDFFNAIPEVIKNIESYDTTTVRASVGNYLISKYISENSKAKVIFNGDGSDELTGGYLYFHKAPNSIDFDSECKRLLKNIHYFDVLRSDRSISLCGLEPRTPFLDKSFVNNYLSIPIELRQQKGIEKKLLRDSFKKYLPEQVLYRKKEAFSDGVSGQERSWYQIIGEKLQNINLPEFQYNEEYLSPRTKEQMYYRYLFEKNYPRRENVIPYFWMPKWSKTNDPSARTL
jgi:asparagine synthase (glutamine-hydrolysing)